jgi:hypothetical protein
MAVLAWLIVSFCQNQPSIAHPQVNGDWAIVSGIKKFWVEPAELLLSLGLSSLAVQRAKQRSLSLLILLPIFWIIGAVLGFYAPPIVILNLVTTPGLEIIGKNPSLLLAIGLIAVGSLVALEKKMSKIWFQVFVIVEGISSGLINGLLLSGHPGGINGLAGETVMIWLFVFFTVLLLKKVSTPWINLAIRIGGSWICAAGLLLFGFLLKYPQ